MFRLFIAKVIC